MKPWYEIDSDVVAAQLGTDPEKGLSAREMATAAWTRDAHFGSAVDTSVRWAGEMARQLLVHKRYWC